MTGIESNLFTAYHPRQMDRRTINQEVKQYLHILVNERQTDGLTGYFNLLSYNDKTHSSTGYSRFYITTGCIPTRTNPRTEYRVSPLKTSWRDKESSPRSRILAQTAAKTMRSSTIAKERLLQILLEIKFGSKDKHHYHTTSKKLGDNDTALSSMKERRTFSLLPHPSSYLEKIHRHIQ